MFIEGLCAILQDLGILIFITYFAGFIKTSVDLQFPRLRLYTTVNMSEMKSRASKSNAFFCPSF